MFVGFNFGDKNNSAACRHKRLEARAVADKR